MNTMSSDELIRIEKNLKKYVKGQNDQIKQILSYIYKTTNFSSSIGTSSNLMIIGPSGSGKTYVVKMLAELLDRKFFSIDASSLSAEGYKGQNLSAILKSLLESCKRTSEFENCILFIDEIDKVLLKGTEYAYYQMLIESSLLKLLNHDKILVGEKHQKCIDTKNMTIICAGAFTNLFNNYTSVGITKRKVNDTEKLDNEMICKKFLNMGFSTEFIGRFTSFVFFDSLKDEDIQGIIKNKFDCDIIPFFYKDGIISEIDDKAVSYILNKVRNSEFNARMIDNYFEEILLNNVYDIITNKSIGKVVLTADDNSLRLEQIENQRNDNKSNIKHITIFNSTNIEDLAHKILSYSKNSSLSYEDSQAMYYYLKSILGYIKYYCDKEEQSTDTIRKYINYEMESFLDEYTLYDGILSSMHNDCLISYRLSEEYNQSKKFGLSYKHLTMMLDALKNYSNYISKHEMEV